MTEATKKTKLARRWLRFNLRSFLIVVTILGAGIGPYLYRAEKQRAGVQWVQENGGIVVYGFEVDQNDQAPNDQPPGPIWLHEILGVDYFECVVAVHLGHQLSDLTPLAGLTNLETLSLLSAQKCDLTPLAGLANLESLRLDFKNAQSSDLTPLASLTNLESLSLDSWNAQTCDLTPLAGLTNLESLSLNFWIAQTCDLKPLAGLTNLENLELKISQVNDLTPLAGLTNLETLSLLSAPTSDLTPLAGLTNLKRLSLRNGQGSDEEIAKLQEALPNCQFFPNNRNANQKLQTTRLNDVLQN